MGDRSIADMPAATPPAATAATATTPSPSPQTRLERAELQYAQAKARLLALKNRAATQARKMDTRRKIILGGALVDLASRDDAAAAMLDRLVRNLPREQDRRTFEGWSPKDALPEGGVADGSGSANADAGGGAGTSAAAAFAPSDQEA